MAKFTTRTRAVLTELTVANGNRYPSGTTFTFSEQLADGRRRITFDHKVGKSVVLAALDNLPYRLLTDKK